MSELEAAINQRLRIANWKFDVAIAKLRDEKPPARPPTTAEELGAHMRALSDSITEMFRQFGLGWNGRRG